jgi:hypothetical protein
MPGARSIDGASNNETRWRKSKNSSNKMIVKPPVIVRILCFIISWLLDWYCKSNQGLLIVRQEQPPEGGGLG